MGLIITTWVFGFKLHSSFQPRSVFIFIGPNSLSRAEDLTAVNYVTQTVARVASKVGFKELRLESKFLNRRLRKNNTILFLVGLFISEVLSIFWWYMHAKSISRGRDRILTFRTNTGILIKPLNISSEENSRCFKMH